MKILFLLKNFNKSGGVERVTERLIRELESKEIQTEICVMNNDEVAAGLKSVTFKCATRIGFIRKLREYIKKENVKHIVSAKEQSNLCLFVATLGLDVNCLYVRHSALGRGVGITYSLCLILFYWIILLNPKSKVGSVSLEINSLIKKCIPFFERRIVYLPNAVIDKKFYELSNEDIPKDLKELVGGSIITVGRLIKSKRISDILEAYNNLDHVKEKIPNLIIVGDGPELEYLKIKARQYNIDDKIHFLGYVDNPYPLIKESSLYILSSEIEGMPTVLIEALALNKTVISSNCKTGPKELLSDGECGYLYPVGDVESLTSYIKKALNSSNFQQDEKSKSVNTYTAENSAEIYLGAFKDGK